MRFPIFLVAAVLCSFTTNMAAQESSPTGQVNGQISDGNSNDQGRNQDKEQNQQNKDQDKEKIETQPASDSVSSSAREKDASLQLGVGDMVEMTVYDVPELTSKTRISSNGDIYCALIGPTHVAGLTTEEAAQLIQKRLSAYLKDPYVTLFVAEYATQGASVLGEVSKPGVYPVMGEQHLFDLISASGGLTEKAGHSISVTHRSDPDKPTTLPISRNLSDDPESNIRVFPGDTIVVRKADIVYVVGDVGRPSGLLMDASGLTVLQAIALSGGTTRTAKLNGTKILHKGPAGMIETPVQLKKILRAQSPDLSLQANDILIVPSSQGKILAGRTLEAAIQVATLVSVTAVP
jgi:polysaccharide biosynthesis/export protein